jgi:hypothetical protein
MDAILIIVALQKANQFAIYVVGCMSQFKVLPCALGNGPSAFSAETKPLLIVVPLTIRHYSTSNSSNPFIERRPLPDIILLLL